MRKSGLTGDEAYILSKHGKTTEDLDPLKKEIGLIKEDLSNKITKFYASNQGETHLADSDNGKIMNMMLYGKSEQFATTGKNLLKIRDKTQTSRGITVTAKDGVFVLKGTAIETGWAVFDVDSFALDGTYVLSSNTSTDIEVLVANKSFKAVLKQNKSNTLENAEVSKVCFVVTDGKTYDISNILVQIEKGSVATSYEPYTGGQPSPSPDYPQEIKSVVNPTVKVSNEDGVESQTVTLPYTLNAIPASSGGNVTIDGQQYIADYVDVERGKLVRMCKEVVLDGTEKWRSEESYMVVDIPNFSYVSNDTLEYMKWLFCNKYKVATNVNNDDNIIFIRKKGNGVVIKDTLHQLTVGDWKKYLNDNPCIVHCLSAIPEEIDLTTEEIIAFKSLATCYPTTNISVNSEQLDGYTVFNYPISMQNGWNYVKQQLNDNRDYIYDMDLQSAEAYVNSEYAVALTELEV